MIRYTEESGIGLSKAHGRGDSFEGAIEDVKINNYNGRNQSDSNSYLKSTSPNGNLQD